jgi:hypothetical protein
VLSPYEVAYGCFEYRAVARVQSDWLVQVLLPDGAQGAVNAPPTGTGRKLEQKHTLNESKAEKTLEYQQSLHPFQPLTGAWSAGRA